MNDYVCYGCINVDVMEGARNLIRRVVDETIFDTNCHGDIIYVSGAGGPNELITEFFNLIEGLYVEVKDAGYDTGDFKFSMFGKIIVNFTDYDEADNVLIMAVNSERKITVFPDR